MDRYLETTGGRSYSIPATEIRDSALRRRVRMTVRNVARGTVADPLAALDKAEAGIRELQRRNAIGPKRLAQLTGRISKLRARNGG